MDYSQFQESDDAGMFVFLQSCYIDQTVSLCAFCHALKVSYLKVPSDLCQRKQCELAPFP